MQILNLTAFDIKLLDACQETRKDEQTKIVQPKKIHKFDTNHFSTERVVFVFFIKKILKIKNKVFRTNNSLLNNHWWFFGGTGEKKCNFIINLKEFSGI